ncbi:hypothetical protein RHGRI_035140 [Rhododendron griersonianum]|uniref:RNase H type-1 domain-containing protein n=1 Tax=Rhododendron griersonianum TaxID=479676 RepID=A0AAV6I412_9ERIC|nr:hypothetical protein RHGRI_035140 [Rhododendron griersonianum]
MGSGFKRRIGECSSLEAELWALRDGLHLAVTIAIPRSEVELDSRMVVEKLMEQFNAMDAKHVHRETNKCTDLLRSNKITCTSQK